MVHLRKKESYFHGDTGQRDHDFPLHDCEE